MFLRILFIFTFLCSGPAVTRNIYNNLMYGYVLLIVSLS